MGEFDFLEPIPKTAITVKLPSKGILYPKGHPAASGKLTLTPMTMLEEALLLNEDDDFGKTMDQMLKRCIQESVDVNSLIVTDKFFLFMMLRAVTYGSDYTFEWLCRGNTNKGKPCNTRNTSTVQIPDNFMIKYLAEEDTEPFTVTLPETKRQISFRLLRGSDEPKIEKHSEEITNIKKNPNVVNKVDTTPAYRLMCHITAVDGNSVAKAPEDKLLAFVLSLPATDRQYLQNKINYYTPGISTTLTVVCKACHTATDLDMPITANFFRTSFQDEEQSGPSDDEV